MKNIISYLDTMKDKSFSTDPFNAVDSLVLSQLSYLRMELFFPEPVADATLTMEALSQQLGNPALYDGLPRKGTFQKFAAAFTACPRFQAMVIRHFISETDPVTEKQFSALCCFLPDDTVHVTYRGTDSTIVGWKEDFNMAFLSPVPSQTEACHYLNAIAELTQKPLRVGGHSKGGNLAVYAAMKCAPVVQARILDIYSHDGPGFREDVFKLPEFQAVRDRIHKYIPQSSIVGMVLERQETGVVIESSQIGFLQHDPFSWVVELDDFVYISSIRDAALLTDEGLNDWINKMTDTERELFVDTLFGVLYSSGATTLLELVGNWKNIAATLGAVRGVDKETRAAGLKLTRELISAISKRFHDYRLERFARIHPHHKDTED